MGRLCVVRVLGLNVPLFTNGEKRGVTALTPRGHTGL